MTSERTEAGTGSLPVALRLVPERSELQKTRPGGRGNRLPAEVREIDGSRTGTKVHGPHDLPPLGKVPAGWPSELRAIWRRLRDEVPWLRQPDRVVAQRYVRLLALHEAAYARVARDGSLDEDMKDSPHWRQFMTTGDRLLRIEQRLGMTPADRTKIMGGFGQ